MDKRQVHEIKRYMRQEVQDHIDPLTGEGNPTTLAEDACSHFDGYGYYWEIPEEYFELAFEVLDSMGLA
jgi:hypothetical protein